MDRRYSLFLKNDATHSIDYYIGFGYQNAPVYPDVSLPEEYTFSKEVRPAQTVTIFEGSVSWSEIFATFQPTDTLSVFVFHSDTVRKYSWSALRDEYKILKRYDLSLQDLERLNYKLSYPPDDRMVGIKMFPN